MRGQLRQTIDLTSVNKGVYLLALSFDNKTTQRKIVLQ